jgi:hypothetical protein
VNEFERLHVESWKAALAISPMIAEKVELAPFLWGRGA